jgi:hypothetical protein
MSEPLEAGQDVSCVLTVVVVVAQADWQNGRWKWGKSNVTGKVDEVVHDGQAKVQSNKVRTPALCVPMDDANAAGWVCLLGQRYHTQRP